MSSNAQGAQPAFAGQHLASLPLIAAAAPKAFRSQDAKNQLKQKGENESFAGLVYQPRHNASAPQHAMCPACGIESAIRDLGNTVVGPINSPHTCGKLAAAAASIALQKERDELAKAKASIFDPFSFLNDLRDDEAATSSASTAAAHAPLSLKVSQNHETQDAFHEQVSPSSKIMKQFLAELEMRDSHPQQSSMNAGAATPLKAAQRDYDYSCPAIGSLGDLTSHASLED